MFYTEIKTTKISSEVYFGSLKYPERPVRIVYNLTFLTATMEINPLSIILVKSDSKGDRMLFRYPHTTNHQRDSSQCTKRKNPYSLIINEDLLQVICHLSFQFFRLF